MLLKSAAKYTIDVLHKCNNYFIRTWTRSGKTLNRWHLDSILHVLKTLNQFTQHLDSMNYLLFNFNLNVFLEEWENLDSMTLWLNVGPNLFSFIVPRPNETWIPSTLLNTSLITTLGHEMASTTCKHFKHFVSIFSRFPYNNATLILMIRTLV